MLTIEDFLIHVFCCVDDLLQDIYQQYPPRARGFPPALSDSEVITMEIVAEYFGIDTEKGIWSYFSHHWLSWFPNIPSRSSFVRQAANLWKYKQILQTKLAQKMGAFDNHLHLIDGIPIPLCCFSRAPRCRSFKGEADYGNCAAKKQTYYGFSGHLVISGNGIITGFTLTSAATNEREAVWDTTDGIKGLLIGDKGYISKILQEQLLQQRNINIQTPLRKNMKDTRPKALVKILMRVRRLIETVIGQLVQRFNIEKVWARDMFHLTSRINRKLLAHTVCYWLNRDNSCPLNFEDLVSA